MMQKTCMTGGSGNSILFDLCPPLSDQAVCARTFDVRYQRGGACNTGELGDVGV